MGAAGVVVALERLRDGGDLRGLFVGVAGHDGGDGAGQGAAFVGIIRQAVAHNERAEIGVAKAEGAEDMGILGDLPGWIAGVIDEDFLRGDENTNGRLEPFDVEFAVVALEFHQVERGEVAGGVVDEDVFGAGVGGVDWLGALAGVPFLDGAVVLHSGVAANPGALGHLGEQRGGVLFLQRGAVGRAARPPFPAFQGGLHESIADAHGEILVLVHDASVGVAIIGAVIALFDQGPGLLFLFLFGIDKLFDVAMPVAQGVHFGRAAGLAAGFDDVGHLVIDLEEGEGAAGPAAAAELLPA